MESCDFVFPPPAAAIAFSEKRSSKWFRNITGKLFLARDESQKRGRDEARGSLMMTLSILLDALRMSLRWKCNIKGEREQFLSRFLPVLSEAPAAEEIRKLQLKKKIWRNAIYVIMRIYRISLVGDHYWALRFTLSCFNGKSGLDRAQRKIHSRTSVLSFGEFSPTLAQIPPALCFAFSSFYRHSYDFAHHLASPLDFFLSARLLRGFDGEKKIVCGSEKVYSRAEGV